MAQRLSIDRIEGDIAVLETDAQGMKMMPLAFLPPGAKEGDVLLLRDGIYTIDHAETERRREHNRRLFERLMQNPIETADDKTE